MLDHALQGKLPYFTNNKMQNCLLAKKKNKDLFVFLQVYKLLLFEIVQTNKQKNIKRTNISVVLFESLQYEEKSPLEKN